MISKLFRIEWDCSSSYWHCLGSVLLHHSTFSPMNESYLYENVQTDITLPSLISPQRYFSIPLNIKQQVIFDVIPLRVLPPIVMGVILYPMVGLVPGLSEFGAFLLVLILFNLTSAAICLFIGIIFEETGVASLIGSLVMLFSLLFAGLLLNHGLS
jgi:ABC-type multidrug transport system permease subunit